VNSAELVLTSKVAQPVFQATALPIRNVIHLEIARKVSHTMELIAHNVQRIVLLVYHLVSATTVCKVHI
jgi:hypothetical protein